MMRPLRLSTRCRVGFAVSWCVVAATLDMAGCGHGQEATKDDPPTGDVRQPPFPVLAERPSPAPIHARHDQPPTGESKPLPQPIEPAEPEPTIQPKPLPQAMEPSEPEVSPTEGSSSTKTEPVATSSHTPEAKNEDDTPDPPPQPAPPAPVPQNQPPPFQEPTAPPTLGPRIERPVSTPRPLSPSQTTELSAPSKETPSKDTDATVLDPAVFDQIRAEIRSRLPYFQACAEAARRRGSPDVRRVQATWFIAADGTIKELKLEDLPDPRLVLCITRMGALPFPVAPGGELTIPTPIVFVR